MLSVTERAIRKACGEIAIWSVGVARISQTTKRTSFIDTSPAPEEMSPEPEQTLRRIENFRTWTPKKRPTQYKTYRQWP